MAFAVPPVSACAASHFQYPTLFGANFTSLQANLVEDYSLTLPPSLQPSFPTVPPTFCNVTVSYTHPGYGDNIIVEAWLPMDSFNGRLQALGGGGWSPGRIFGNYITMAGVVSNGYATVVTDAGLGPVTAPDPWALVSPGNLNLVGLSNFGSVAFNDESVIAKDVIRQFYGSPPSYSYFNGCSQGGRQGYMLAQQYPTAYDGIPAVAPVMNWAPFIMSTIWPAFYMNSTGQYPLNCELDQLTAFAKKTCDELDGIKDGQIGETEQCLETFDPKKHIGETFLCADTKSEMKVSAAAADVAMAIWRGPTLANGKFLWYGYDVGASLSSIAGVSCSSNGECFAGGQASISDWVRNFIAKDSTTNVTSLTRKEFDSFYRQLKHAFGSFMETGEVDLTDFRDAGGKLVTYHGLADQAVPTWNSLSYYRAVSEYFNGTAADFYRYYRVPGLEHCSGGSSSQPAALFDQLRGWVENGTAPEPTPVTVTTPDNSTRLEYLCPYPQKPRFNSNCANQTDLVCWSCSGALAR